MSSANDCLVSKIVFARKNAKAKAEKLNNSI